MRGFVASGLVVAIAICAMRFGAADGQEKKAVGKETLENLVADGLKNSADIKVAEVKVRLAEAELEQARAQAKAKIAIAFTELMATRMAEKEAEIRRTRADQLKQRGAITTEDHAVAVLTWTKLRNERTMAEQRLQNLVGRPIGEITEPTKP